MTFFDVLTAARARSRVAIGIMPIIHKMPRALQRYDDPFFPFGKAVIDATHDLTCMYIFDLAAYLSQGASGAVALERTIAYVPPGILKILHGPFASADYVRAAFEEGFGTDAVTLSGVTAEIIRPYVRDPHRGVFVRIPADANFDRNTLMQAREDHQGQIGVYRQIAAGHNVLELFFDSVPEIQWYWDDIIYASIDDDYGVAMHQAAADRQIPTNLENPN
jgi:hypothetical protein